MSDVRDDALASLLDESVRRIDPSPEDRLTAIRRRGSARRAARWVAIGTALAVSLAAVAWAGLALRSETPTTAPLPSNGGAAGDTWRTDQDERLGLSFRHPEAWPVGIVDTTCRVTFQGVLIPNGPFTSPDAVVLDQSGCVPTLDLVELPQHPVIVAITRWEGGPLPNPSNPSDRPDTRFPLSIDWALPEPGFWPPSLSALEELTVMTLAIQVRGDERYAVRLFTSPEASDDDRAIAERIIATIGLINPCAHAPTLIVGLLSCEEAIQSLPANDQRILGAWYDPASERAVWAFVTEPFRFYKATPFHPTPVCYEGAQEILMDAMTGELVGASGLGGRTPCTSP